MELEEVERLLGRKLEYSEHVMFLMFGKSSQYKPIKDKKGNLRYENNSK